QRAGSYNIQALIRDSGGLTVTSNLSLTVNQTPTSVTVSPSSAVVYNYSTKQFTAALLDQFGNTMPQPTATTGWTELFNTKLQDACPPNYFGGQNYTFYDNCHYVITAWNGGIADTLRNRLIIWGGGHANYSGNELYSLN